MKRITSVLFAAVLLATSALSVCTVPVPALADTTPAVATAAAPAVAAVPVAIAQPAPIQTMVAAPNAMPAWQSLPAQHDVGSILVWIIGFLVPWLGWLASEILPFLPGRANGLLHGFIDALKAPSYDPQSNAVTLQLNEIKAAIADFKGQAASTGTTGA